MGLTRWAVLLGTAMALGGCVALRPAEDTAARRAIGPEELDGQYAVDGRTPLTLGAVMTAAGDVTGAVQVGWIAMAKKDSMDKCEAFMARLTSSHDAADLAFDVTTLGLAGASSVTLPARSAQLLAALAGMSAGARAAFDTDVFQQNTAPFIAKQINDGYWAAISRYSVPLSTDATLNVADEYTKIQLIHHDCSLNYALAQMTGANATAAPSLSLSDVADKAKFTAQGMTIQVTVPPGATPTSYTLTFTIAGVTANSAIPGLTQQAALGVLTALNAKKAAAGT